MVYAYSLFSCSIATITKINVKYENKNRSLIKLSLFPFPVCEIIAVIWQNFCHMIFYPFDVA